MRGILSVAVLALGACSTSVSFSVTHSANTTVERCPLGVSVLQSLGFDGFSDLDMSSTSEFRNQGVQPSDVESIKLRRFSLQVENPVGGDMRYLTRVSFFAEAPGQPRVLVASRSGFPSGTTSVDFETPDVELKPYITADTMKLTTDIESNSCPSEDQTLKATAVFDVEATAKGVQRYLSSQR